MGSKVKKICERGYCEVNANYQRAALFGKVGIIIAKSPGTFCTLNLRLTDNPCSPKTKLFFRRSTCGKGTNSSKTKVLVSHERDIIVVREMGAYDDQR